MGCLREACKELSHPETTTEQELCQQGWSRSPMQRSWQLAVGLCDPCMRAGAPTGRRQGVHV